MEFDEILLAYKNRHHCYEIPTLLDVLTLDTETCYSRTCCCIIWLGAAWHLVLSDTWCCLTLGAAWHLVLSDTWCCLTLGAVWHLVLSDTWCCLTLGAVWHLVLPWCTAFICFILYSEDKLEICRSTLKAPKASKLLMLQRQLGSGPPILAVTIRNWSP